jgi:hypothetical protein
MRFSNFACAAFAIAAMLQAPASHAQDKGAPDTIEIQAREITSFDRRNPEARRFGALEFVGGLVLESKHKNFGGISGLHIAQDGVSFTAHSDRGHWLRGKFKLDGDRVTGIENAGMAPMLGPDGRTLTSRRWFDTEALTADSENFYVGIERANRILRYRIADGMNARGIPVQIPSGIRNLPFNQGLEALAFVPKAMPLAGSLLAIAELGLDEKGNILAFILGGPTPGIFTIKRIGSFEISDAAISPTGHLIIVERYFRFVTGIHLRIRAIPLSEVKPGALVDGTVLLEADSNFDIDNMEALSITKNAAGQIMLTMLSDNNFNYFQRTILLRFRWPQ